MPQNNASNPLGVPPAAFNLASYVLGHAHRLPDKIALEVIGSNAPRFTYKELEQAVLGTATGLRRIGLSDGQRVLLRLDNSPLFPIAFLGAIAAGLLPAPVSAQLTDGEVDAIAKMIAPAAIITDRPTAGRAELRITPEELQGFQSLPAANPTLGAPDRPAYIIFTSGTSGRPRAVVHAHRAIWARRMMWEGWYGLRESDRVLHAGAFNWTYTLGTGLLDPWSIGATALIPVSGTDATDLAPILARTNATIFAAAPGVYRRMLRGSVPRLPALRHGLSAGEKLPQALRQRWQESTGTDLHEAFGMTECSTFISGSPNRPAPDGALGFAQSGRRVAVIGLDGPVVAPAQGTIAIHKTDPGLMLGYLDAPEETAARFSGDWFLTGDIGIQQSDGAICYQGRADDMLNAGGHRVSPLEVEAAMTAHPAITEAAAVAVTIRPDVTVIAGFYVAQDVIDQDSLSLFLQKKLARYKQPRLLVPCDHLPRNANNKLMRQKLRQQWETAHGQA